MENNKESLESLAAQLTSFSLKEVEKAMIIAKIKQTNGNFTKSAKELKIDRRTFYRKLQRYGIDTGKMCRKNGVFSRDINFEQQNENS